MYNVWTYLKRKNKNTFVLEKTVRIDHRVWSLHELVELFESTGWKFKAAYPGFYHRVAQPKKEGAPQEANLLKTRYLLVIAYHPEINL